METRVDRTRVNWGLGPFKENGEYVHSGVCSGSRRHPRRPGNTCSCWRSDLFFNRLFFEKHYDGTQYTGNAKRTIRASTCDDCGILKVFPYSSDPIPRETFCSKCFVWAKVEELSWDGVDFSQYLPVVSR